MNKLITIILFFLYTGNLYSQDIPRYNHYFTYSYLYNPAFLGRVEASQLNLIYRKQWVGLDGAPEFFHAGFQLPLSQNLAIGLNASNIEQGVINETSAMGSLAYTVNLGINNTLSFGISVGAGRTALDGSQITDFSDPAIAGALDKSFYMEGQAGLSLNLNRLNISVSLPTIFEKTTFSDKDFQDVSLGPLNSTFSSLSYRFDISPMFSVEPMGVYQMDNQLEDQWQGYMTLRYNDMLWLGGNYSEGYGAAAYVGFEVNDFLKIGYSFDFSNTDLSVFNSHEFYLSLRIGSKKVDRSQQYVTKLKPTPVIEFQPKENESVAEDGKQDEKEDLKEPISEQVEDNKQAQPIKVEKVAIVEPSEEELIIEEKEPLPVELVEEKQLIPETLKESNTDGMASGFYVVVGAFTSKENALTYIEQLSNENYEPKLAYNTRTQYNYVYLLYTQSPEDAKKLRDDLRNRKELKFEDSWLLNIK